MKNTMNILVLALALGLAGFGSQASAETANTNNQVIVINPGSSIVIQPGVKTEVSCEGSSAIRPFCKIVREQPAAYAYYHVEIDGNWVSDDFYEDDGGLEKAYSVINDLRAHKVCQ